MSKNLGSYATTLTEYTTRMIQRWESTSVRGERETNLVNYSDMFQRTIADLITDGKLNPNDVAPYIQKYGEKYFSKK
jgi:hypothetical protein